MTTSSRPTRLVVRNVPEQRNATAPTMPASSSASLAALSASDKCGSALPLGIVQRRDRVEVTRRISGRPAPPIRQGNAGDWRRKPDTRYIDQADCYRLLHPGA